LLKLHIRNEVSTRKTLDGLNFEIMEGEFFGIIGRNGSGKSTLLKILAGIYCPDQGSEITIHGRLATDVGTRGWIQSRIDRTRKCLPQRHDSRHDQSTNPRPISEMVRFAELEPFMELQVKHYSSGMSVRLAFAVAMQVDCPIMLLDEVLAVGDFVFAEKCFAHFEKCKREGKTIILVTHDATSMERFADRAMLIHQSHLEAIGNPHEVLEKYKALG
jgi:ABC-type polysaccharide/polyol phosphate transport system ATPase subunit